MFLPLICLVLDIPMNMVKKPQNTLHYWKIVHCIELQKLDIRTSALYSHWRISLHQIIKYTSACSWCVWKPRVHLLFVCVFVSHLSAEPAAILLPSVDQEHLSRFWKTGADVWHCVSNVTHVSYYYHNEMKDECVFIRKESREWWEGPERMKGDVTQLRSTTCINTTSRTAAVGTYVQSCGVYQRFFTGWNYPVLIIACQKVTCFNTFAGKNLNSLSCIFSNIYNMLLWVFSTVESCNSTVSARILHVPLIT